MERVIEERERGRGVYWVKMVCVETGASWQRKCCLVSLPCLCAGFHSICKALGLKRMWSCDVVRDHLLRKQLDCDQLDLLLDVSFEKVNSKQREGEREREMLL